MSEGLRIEQRSGVGLAAVLEPLAQLRIAVFREWPYLYQGSADYEMRYLDTYVRCPRSLAVLVWDGPDCVGASTALPLADADEATRAPFEAAGHPQADIHYFGESILLRDYRGRGLGVKFFDLREAHARELGLRHCAFCAVQRPEDHPARPAGYVPNDAFWTRRGYRPQPDLHTTYEWPDIGETRSTAKPMRFWMKTL
jgi:GNAT superfamily N-acetyltransferase